MAESRSKYSSSGRPKACRREDPRRLGVSYIKRIPLDTVVVEDLTSEELPYVHKLLELTQVEELFTAHTYTHAHKKAYTT
jgi:hypothetical protein